MTSRARFWRRLSSLLLTLWLIAVVASFVHRQLRRRPTVAPVELGEVATTTEDAPVRVQKGFVWNDVLGVEPNFRVAAQETVEFASGWYELRDVSVSTYKAGAVAYQLSAETARINTVEKQGLLQGEVQLAFEQGVAVQTDAVSWEGTEQLLESRASASFAGPGWGGLAGRLIVNLETDTIELRDGVSVSWRQSAGGSDPVVLLAPTVVYQRTRGLLTCPSGVTFLRGGLRIGAPGAVIQLELTSGRVVDLELDAPVTMSGPLAAGGWVDGEAGMTTLESRGEGRVRLTAGPVPGRGWVVVRWSSPTGAMRELRTWRMVGEGSQDAWEWLEAQERVCGQEVADGVAGREMVADNLLVEFAEGRARTARATGAVRVDLGSSWAEGGELTYSLTGASFTMLPAAGEWVQAGSADLRAECQRVEGTPEGGVIASGQVHGAMEAGSTRAGEVTRFAAASARLQGDHVVLQEDARLWQGDRLVRADTLDYDRTADRIVAKGNVLTTGSTVSREGRLKIVRVQARSLDYARQAGVAVYGGDVRLEDEDVTAECQELAVTLGASGGIVYATLGGGVTMRQAENDRVIRGQGARILVAADTVQIWGTPVVITEPDGNTVSGDMITWDRSEDSVLVQGSKDSPSETIYVRTPEGPLPVRPTQQPGKGSRP